MDSQQEPKNQICNKTKLKWSFLRNRFQTFPCNSKFWNFHPKFGISIQNINRYKMRLFNTTWFYYLNGNAIDDEVAVEITSDMEGFRIRDDFVLEIESRIIRNSMFLSALD